MTVLTATLWYVGYRFIGSKNDSFTEHFKSKAEANAKAKRMLNLENVNQVRLIKEVITQYEWIKK